MIVRKHSAVMECKPSCDADDSERDSSTASEGASVSPDSQMTFLVTEFDQNHRLVPTRIVPASAGAGDNCSASPIAGGSDGDVVCSDMRDAEPCVDGTGQCRMAAEDNEGNVEYKWRLTGITTQRFEHLVTQLQFRMTEGHGHCLYELGVTDEGVPKGLTPRDFEESVDVVQRMATRLGCDARLIHRCIVCTTPEPLVCGELLVSRRRACLQDVGLAFCGPLGVGKSTIMGVLLTNSLDDGAGSARQLLFNHRHELEWGKTSSFVSRLLSLESLMECSPGEGSSGSDEENEALLQSPKPQKSKLFRLMDLGGGANPRMLSSFMGREPDYVCVCVAANRSPEEARLYAQMCRVMGTPLLVVVTKCEIVEDFELDAYIMELAAVLSESGYSCDVVDEAADDVVSHFYTLSDGECAPVWRVPLFLSSAVTGEGLSPLRAFLADLERPHALSACTDSPSEEHQPVEVILDYGFTVKGVGPVVRGCVSHGVMRVGSSCFMGPDRQGAFYPVIVRGIHVEQVNVAEAQRGDEATFALSGLPDSVVLPQKGKILASQPQPVCFTFTATVTLLTNQFTAKLQPVVYTRNVRQSAYLDSFKPISPDVGATKGGGDAFAQQIYQVVCTFRYRPEVLTVGSLLALQWGSHKIAIGRVVATENSFHFPNPSFCPVTATRASSGDD